MRAQWNRDSGRDSQTRESRPAAFFNRTGCLHIFDDGRGELARLRLGVASDCDPVKELRDANPSHHHAFCSAHSIITFRGCELKVINGQGQSHQLS
jgi:hypothetical protein